MKRIVKAKRGRPRHVDDPAHQFSTTIPDSVRVLLTELSEVQQRPKSEVISDAIRAYARRFIKT
jgi:hypothetical protein